MARDKNNNITETIKIITHSMVGAYGKGFIAGLKAYMKDSTNRGAEKIKITLNVDFDPYQAGDMEAGPDIKTRQYKHVNPWNIIGMGWLANEDEHGLGQEDIFTNAGTSTALSIFSFFSDIGKLEEGTYIWNGNRWVLQ